MQAWWSIKRSTLPWIPSNVISIGAAATSDNISPISRLPLQEGDASLHIVTHLSPIGSQWQTGRCCVPKLMILPLLPDREHKRRT